MGISSATLAYIGLAATVASTATGLYAASEQAGAQADAAKYQAAVEQNNQIIAGRNAAAATQQGEVQAQEKEMETAQRVGAVRASAAANGLDVNSGSPLLLEEDTSKLGTLDAMTIRNNAARTAYDFEVTGMSDQANAQLDTSKAANDIAGGNITMLSDIAGGAGSFSDKWAQYQLKGAFNNGGGGLLVNNNG